MAKQNGNTTKQRIIQKAIKLFNERGFSEVTVRDLAAALEMSPGNITYHFSDKEDLMASVYRFMQKTLSEMSISDRLFIKKGEELNVARIYLEYMGRFRFFFQDTVDIIRAYPEIGRMHRMQVREELHILRNLIDLGIGRGVFIPEPAPRAYDALAEVTWQTLHFWYSRRIIRGENGDSPEDALITLNSLLYPYFTEKGQLDFKGHLSKLSSNT